MASSGRKTKPLDTELAELSPEQRWREWMGRVEAVIFAAAEPVSRPVLAGMVGQTCNLDLLIADIRADLRQRPYDLVEVAGGFQYRTRPHFAEVIRTARVATTPRPLSSTDAAVLMTIAYLQPITRTQLGIVLGSEIALKESLQRLRTDGLIAPGPRSPEPGAPYTYITTTDFLSRWNLNSLQELPDLERLRDAGLLSKASVLGRTNLPI